jgi:hypothetical protein
MCRLFCGDFTSSHLDRIWDFRGGLESEEGADFRRKTAHECTSCSFADSESCAVVNVTNHGRARGPLEFQNSQGIGIVTNKDPESCTNGHRRSRVRVAFRVIVKAGARQPFRSSGKSPDRYPGLSRKDRRVVRDGEAICGFRKMKEVWSSYRAKARNAFHVWRGNWPDENIQRLGRRPYSYSLWNGPDSNCGS